MSNGSESVEYEVYDGEKIDINAEDVIREFVKKGLIGDRYCDLKKIAEGGMGEVMLGKDIGLLRKTVLKIIHPRLLKNSDQFARFITEARITGQLEHPNIVPVHDLGILDGELLYFSMKYIEGKELGQILESLRLGDPKSQRFSIFSLLTIFRKICDAVAYAHSKGIIHRDIKPDNIMVGNYGEVLLVDWGLARHVDEPLEKASPTATKDFFDEDNPGSATRTRDGIIKGTPAFMSPEQALGEVEIVNASTDIFLLGATLYAIATLEAPYAVSSKDDIYKILQRAEECDFIPPLERSPHRMIPHELQRIILKAMAFNQDERYLTVQELNTDLDQLMEGFSQSATEKFDVGDHLMREGESGDRAFVIQSGEVEVYKLIEGNKVTLVRLGEGSTVGEMALIDQGLRSASVVATKPTEVVVITAEIMETALEKLPPWMGQTINSITHRLRGANSDIHPLMRSDCIYQVMSMIRYLFPYCGKVIQDSRDPEQKTVIFDAQDVILEISTQLCIKPDNVLDAITRLMQTKLLLVENEDFFTIPNYDLFCHFVEYCRARMAQQSGIISNISSKVFGSENKILFMLDREDEETADTELIEVVPCDAKDLLKCKENELPEKFRQLFDFISASGNNT